MIQTASFKDRLRNGFTVFKWELRNCSGALLVFTILATVFTAIILTLALAIGFLDTNHNSITESADPTDIRHAVMAFQWCATYVIFYMNMIFTIIYTVRIFSYLHNKRKADMYGSLPIGRRTFFVSKTISAYLLSVVPALFFCCLIAFISLCFGQPLTEVMNVCVKLLLGSFTSISFYALLAVCCGTTANAVLCFVAINIAYPIASLFIKSTMRAFFFGMVIHDYDSSYIMKALNPLMAYDISSIICWLLFTIACLVLGIFLIKKRRAECAQTSFAYYLPAYFVKLLVAFIMGMFLGTLFGSLNVFGVPIMGFVFGFLLGSMPTYLIAHMIFYRGLNRFPRTLIAFGAMSVTVIVAMIFCFFDFFGYNRYVPALDDVQSAGVVNLGECCYAGTTNVRNIAKMAEDDYTDATMIKKIQQYHQSMIRSYEKATSNHFVNVWVNMFFGKLSYEISLDDSYVVAYKLQDGRTVMRYYTELLYLLGSSYHDDMADNAVNSIIASEEYYRRYSTVLNAPYDMIHNIAIDASRDGSSDSVFHATGIQIREIKGKVSAAQAAADRQKVIEAYCVDYERLAEETQSKSETIAKNVREDDQKDDVFYLHLHRTRRNSDMGSLLTDWFNRAYPQYGRGADTAKVTEDYIETRKVLREIGVLDQYNQINLKCDYMIAHE